MATSRSPYASMESVTSISKGGQPLLHMGSFSDSDTGPDASDDEHEHEHAPDLDHDLDSLLAAASSSRAIDRASKSVLATDVFIDSLAAAASPGCADHHPAGSPTRTRRGAASISNALDVWGMRSVKLAFTRWHSAAAAAAALHSVQVEQQAEERGVRSIRRVINRWTRRRVRLGWSTWHAAAAGMRAAQLAARAKGERVRRDRLQSKCVTAPLPTATAPARSHHHS